MSADRYSRPRATVLLAVFDPALRGAWARALEAARFAAIATGDVEVAVGHAREGGIDVVVFDGSERPADGRLLVEQLDRLPEPPPLILVSSSRHAPELSAHLGAAAFIPKPCAADDIVAECEHLLGGRSRRSPDDEDGPTSPRMFGSDD